MKESHLQLQEEYSKSSCLLGSFFAQNALLFDLDN